MLMSATFNSVPLVGESPYLTVIRHLVLAINGEGACLGDQVFVDRNIFARLLAIATLFDTSER